MRFIPRGLLVSVLLTACGDDTGDTGTAPTPRVCAADRVCTEVVPQGTPVPGRLVVVWFRFESGIGRDPFVAYDVTFDLAQTTADVVYAQIASPPDVVMLCDRACADPATCPCTGEAQAAVGYLMLIQDGDQSGAIEALELSEPSNIVGIGNFAVGYSSRDWDVAPAAFESTFAGPVWAGIHAYELSGGQLQPADAGETFELKIGPDVF